GFAARQLREPPSPRAIAARRATPGCPFRSLSLASSPLASSFSSLSDPLSLRALAAVRDHQCSERRLDAQGAHPRWRRQPVTVRHPLQKLSPLRLDRIAGIDAPLEPG